MPHFVVHVYLFVSVEAPAAAAPPPPPPSRASELRSTSIADLKRQAAARCALFAAVCVVVLFCVVLLFQSMKHTRHLQSFVNRQGHKHLRFFREGGLRSRLASAAACPCPALFCRKFTHPYHRCSIINHGTAAPFCKYACRQSRRSNSSQRESFIRSCFARADDAVWATVHHD
jgi:hypothetical protein